MQWDIQHALRAREMLADVGTGRAAVERVLDAFETRVTPVWPRLRAQVCHTDLTVDNALTDEAGLITGIVDFGDMSHTALLTDLASALDSVCGGRDGDELFRAARLVIDGYQRRVPLEEQELAVLGVAWAARSALTVAISSWRVAQGLEDQAWAERYNALALRMIDTLESAGWGVRELGGEGPRRPDPTLEARRALFLASQLDAVSARIDMLQGKRMSFDEESRRLYGVVAPRHDERYYQDALAAVDAATPGTGTLAERAESLRQRSLVPKDRLDEVLKRGLDVAFRAAMHLGDLHHEPGAKGRVQVGDADTPFELRFPDVCPGRRRRFDLIGMQDG